MGKYSQYSANYSLAEKFYEHDESSKYTGLFLHAFDGFCKKIGVEYSLKEDANSVEISLYSVQIKLMLNDNRQIVQADIYGMGEIINGIRESIWNTKTFFGVPVLMVMNTNMFDDESSWEVCPRQFMVIMMPK